MQALLIISHGSRRASSNNEILRLEQNLKTSLKKDYPIVISAFLEFSPDSIPNAIHECIAKGATSVKVLPYFLAAGVHVTDDIPQEIAEACKSHEQLDVEILPHIGSSNNMTNLISNMLTQTEATHAI